MADVVETKCPLCERPRPPRARRCVCNYTFEYDRAVSAQRAGPASVSMQSVVLGAATTAAIAIYFFAAPAIREGGDAHPETGYFIVPVGLFATAGALFGWRWFFAWRRARLVVAVLGMTGARMFYALLGGGLVGVGIAFLAT